VCCFSFFFKKNVIKNGQLLPFFLARNLLSF
jgi:hypothetical protein